jgi:type I restriction enzyme S subunit
MLCDKVYRMRCKKRIILPAYLEVVLNTPDVVDMLDRLKTGISDSGVNLTQARFSRLQVPVPSLEVQAEIVAAVDRQLSVVEHLEADIEAKLERSSTLRAGILGLAFSGRLVAHDSTAESATELLERIGSDKKFGAEHLGRRRKSPDSMNPSKRRGRAAPSAYDLSE